MVKLHCKPLAGSWLVAAIVLAVATDGLAEQVMSKVSIVVDGMMKSKSGAT
jgi:hypothetical protein